MPHTKTPWAASGYNIRAGGKIICRVISDGDDGTERKEAKANTRHIVKCVNAHDDLVASVTTLRAFAELISSATVETTVRDMIVKANAALAKVGKA